MQNNILTRRRLVALGATAVIALPLRSIAIPTKKTLFGVNCFDLFSRQLNLKARDQNPLTRLQGISDAGIPFVRFSASAFWPKEWAFYDRQPELYFALLDKVVTGAEKTGVKLVPSLIWHPASLAEFLQEHVSAWGNPKSKTRQYSDQFFHRIITRYKSSSAILFWEFSNEFNSFVDMVGSERYYPKVNVAQGTAPQRSALDRLSSADVASAYSNFATLVRSIDGRRGISSGANIPRSRVANNAMGKWSMDTRSQLETAFGLSVAGKTDILSIHLYAESLKERFGPEGTTYLELLQIARRAADQKNAHLFVGEFGAPTGPDETMTRKALAEMINAIQAVGADYAAVWVYDYIAGDSYNITPTNERSWQLEMLRQANA